MIAVTGDSRGEAGYERLASDPVVSTMGKEDYLIILGGCGITEPRIDLDETISAYRDLPCSVLFLDGAYDDYDLLSEYPLFPWNGGKIQVFSRGISRLMRGQVFTLEGKRILTMGGAVSEDRSDSERYWSWWPEQEISEDDLNEAGKNLQSVGNRVDYVFSSACPRTWNDNGDAMLDRVLGMVDYGHWYFSGPEVQNDHLGLNAEYVSGTVVRITPQ